MGDVLVYLESRPLGEVFALFQDIIFQLTPEPVKVTNGTDISRRDSDASGGGNPGFSSDCIPAMEAQQGNSGTEGGN